MRPEDRRPAKRVFPLLQNLDLDNVTFDQLQSVGEPISIEDMNEQELQDLVLVNLARLCVKSEWEGLLSSSSASGAAQLSPVYDSYPRLAIHRTPPWGTGSAVTEVNISSGAAKPIAMPFMCPTTGTVTEMGIHIEQEKTAGNDNLLVGIYTDNGGLPDELMGFATFDLEVTGDEFQTSLSATISLTRSEQYWYAFAFDGTGTGTTGNLEGVNINGINALGPTANVTSYSNAIRHDTTQSGLPDPFTPDGKWEFVRPFLTLKIG